ncbi:MAG: hypothetical protein Q8876_06145 [Bacillota bacterium]|nr:hypothetical protein [Bacillota bacterium]
MTKLFARCSLLLELKIGERMIKILLNNKIVCNRIIAAVIVLCFGVFIFKLFNVPGDMTQAYITMKNNKTQTEYDISINLDRTVTLLYILPGPENEKVLKLTDNQMTQYIETQKELESGQEKLSDKNSSTLSSKENSWNICMTMNDKNYYIENFVSGADPKNSSDFYNLIESLNKYFGLMM